MAGRKLGQSYGRPKLGKLIHACSTLSYSSRFSFFLRFFVAALFSPPAHFLATVDLIRWCCSKLHKHHWIFYFKIRNFIQAIQNQHKTIHQISFSIRVCDFRLKRGIKTPSGILEHKYQAKTYMTRHLTTQYYHSAHQFF